VNTVGSLLREIASWLPDGAQALVIAAIAAVLGRVAMGWVTTRLGDSERGRMLGRFAAVVVWGAGSAAALSRIGVPASVTLPIAITVLVVVVVGVGLAMLLAGGAARAVRPRLHLVDSETRSA